MMIHIQSFEIGSCEEVDVFTQLYSDARGVIDNCKNLNLTG